MQAFRNKNCRNHATKNILGKPKELKNVDAINHTKGVIYVAEKLISRKIDIC